MVYNKHQQKGCHILKSRIMGRIAWGQNHLEPLISGLSNVLPFHPQNWYDPKSVAKKLGIGRKHKATIVQVLSFCPSSAFLRESWSFYHCSRANILSSLYYFPTCAIFPPKKKHIQETSSRFNSNFSIIRQQVRKHVAPQRWHVLPGRCPKYIPRIVQIEAQEKGHVHR